MQRTQRDLLLGLVFFAGLGLLLWATFNLGSISMRTATRLQARFPNAAGLRDGDQVQVLGCKSGQVISVRPDPNGGENRVLVELQLDAAVSLRSDATIAIRDSGLLGGKSVDIDPGRAAGEFDVKKPWVGVTSRAPFDSISETFAGDDNKANLAGALKGLRELLESANNPKGSVGALLKERDLYNSTLDAISGVARIVQALEQGQGALGALLRDEKIAADVRAMVAVVRETVDKVREGKSPLGRLLFDEALGKNLYDTVADATEIVRGIRNGQGAFGVLARDPDTANAVKDSLGEFREIVRKFNDPKAGMAGALLGSIDWRDMIQRTLENVSAMSTEMRSGHGLFARLINDRELGERFERIFIQVSRALEDAREAAPVGTIIQVLSGIF